MKKLLLSTLFIFIACSVYEKCYAQYELVVNDTRAINDVPSDFKKKVRFDFKDRNLVGAPGTGLFSGMMTFAPWSDNTEARTINSILMMEEFFTEWVPMVPVHGRDGENW